MLKLESLEKAIDGFTLGPVDLQLDPGFAYAIVGPNGSGKSMLFRLLMGLLQPDAGSIQRFGQPLRVDDLTQTTRIAYVPEALTGHDGWSVADLASLYARVYPAFDMDASADFLGDIDRSKQFGKHSKGRQRRIMLALALASGADLLLLDEPTDGLDPFVRQESLSDLTSYLESGDRTILISTHNLEDVRRIADHILLLHQGQLVGGWERDSLLGSLHRLLLSAEPPVGLPGEIARSPGPGHQIVTRDIEATRAALAAAGIRELQSAPLDSVETLETMLKARGSPEPGAGDTHL